MCKMKRMTVRCGGNVVTWAFNMDFLFCVSEEDYDGFKKLMEKLAAYEDAEEEGRLVVLPCKVGDTVYEIHNNTDACHKCCNFSSFYGMDARCDVVKGDDRYYPEVAESPICEKQFFEIVEWAPSIDWIFKYRDGFGKTIFLAKEEAEAALEKMEG